MRSASFLNTTICLSGACTSAPPASLLEAYCQSVSWNDGGREGFSRAYLHHLDRCGEMLGPMLTTIHNLHYYLMREIREALDAGTFTEFRARFKSDRARGV